MGPTTKGRWSYACSKALDEFLALAYWREKRVPVTVTRFFNTVGPRQTGQYGMVVPNFVEQALLGDPITVYGTGEQKRCFGYVGEVVECLARIAAAENVAGEIINIGNDQEISIRQLAELVKEVAGSSSEIRRISYDAAYEPGLRGHVSANSLVRETHPLDRLSAAYAGEADRATRGRRNARENPTPMDSGCRRFVAVKGRQAVP